MHDEQVSSGGKYKNADESSASNAQSRDPGDAWPTRPQGFAGFSSTAPDWYAWINAMPPGMPSFHVLGDVLVANPGVCATLTMRSPQGFNPQILILDLTLYQQPGNWIALISNIQARFDRVLVPGSQEYTGVEIILNGERVAFIDKIDKAE